MKSALNFPTALYCRPLSDGKPINYNESKLQTSSDPSYITALSLFSDSRPLPHSATSLITILISTLLIYLSALIAQKGVDKKGKFMIAV